MSGKRQHCRQHHSCVSLFHAYIPVLESDREYDRGLTQLFMGSEIATSPSAPRNDKSALRIAASAATQSGGNRREWLQCSSSSWTECLEQMCWLPAVGCHTPCSLPDSSRALELGKSSRRSNRVSAEAL